MSDSERGEVTRLLQVIRAQGGSERDAVDRLFEAVYAELRHLASGIMRGERRDHTLQATALVNQAYVRLAGESGLQWQDRAHFLGVAARAMRQILVDHARRRRAIRRGGDWRQVTFDDEVGLIGDEPIEIIGLDRVLTRFAELDPRAAQVVELRVFSGMNMEEIAEVLKTSVRTVHNDWRVAKMWLGKALTEDESL